MYKSFSSFAIAGFCILFFVCCNTSEQAPATAATQATVLPASTDDHSLADTSSNPAACCAVLKFEEVKFVEHDFNEGDTIHHRFKFSNEGDIPLTIASVHTSCSCTAYALSDKTIAPKKSAYIDLAMVPEPHETKKQIYATVTANTAEKYHKLIFEIDKSSKQ